MTRKRNPHSQSKVDSVEAADTVALESGTVISAPPRTNGSGGHHSVQVKLGSFDTPEWCDVLATQRGDAYIPQEGDEVIVGYQMDGTPTVLGTRYRIGESMPDYDAGEKVVGHPLSSAEVRLKPNGDILVENGSGTNIDVSGNTVTVNGDATLTNGSATVEVSGTDVIINGGTKGAIHNVTTSKDADGHVTSITLERRSNILI